jgi:type II secretory ATPase GspE/PulE/Tfp pilus assembly ATPase PilB-like protein
MFWTKKRKTPKNGKKARSASETASNGLEALRRSRPSSSPSDLDIVPAPIDDPAEMRMVRADDSGAGWGRHSSQSRQEVQELPDDVHFNLPNEVVGTLSPSLARALTLLPYRIEGTILHVACGREPSSRVTARVEHELRVIAGLELSPRFRVVASAPLVKLINTYYPTGETEPIDPDSSEYDSSPFGELDAEALEILSVDAGTLPSDFAKRVIYAALLARAHDVRITSHPRYCRILFIIDGLGMFFGPRLPRSASRSLSNIFKTWCGVPAAMTRKTIHSSFQRNMVIDGQMRHIVARVMFQPAPGDDGAETVVIRLHGRSGRYLITGFPYTGSDENVAWLDVDPRARREIAAIIRDDTAGLVCCVGPMGNGKSTLLTAIIEAHNRELVPISTIEDPPEFFPDDVHQIEFDERNNTYAENVANLLRSAAKKTVVSEAREVEVVRLLEEHSLSAQQIFTTFHADDSVLAFERLRQLKYSLAGMASIRSVFAMRLIPKLCGCAVPVDYDPEYLRGGCGAWRRAAATRSSVR